MSNLPARADETTVLDDLVRLRAEFPGWHLQHLDPRMVNLPWEANRDPFKFPAGGGISWIRAGSAERLRQLLDGVAEVEARR